MTEKGDMYACTICGNVVKVISPGSGVLVCCGQSMQFVGGEED